MTFKINTPEIIPDIIVNRVYIRLNVWGNYGLFVGTKKVRDGMRKNDLIDYATYKYPNAEIIDCTIL